jgi:rhodanese-related sulfurtransferase
LETQTVYTTCDPETAKQVLCDGGRLLDVRNPDEYAAGHVPGSVCIPLPDLEKRAADIPRDTPVVVTCQSGSRGEMAVERLRAIGFTNVTNLQGGVTAWKAAGLEMREQKGVIPLERQVRGIAGTMVFLGTLAGVLGVTWAFAVPLFVGFMLALSGVTGLCPMLSMLKLMPWNKMGNSATR